MKCLPNIDRRPIHAPWLNSPPSTTQNHGFFKGFPYFCHTRYPRLLVNRSPNIKSKTYHAPDDIIKLLINLNRKAQEGKHTKYFRSSSSSSASGYAAGARNRQFNNNLLKGLLEQSHPSLERIMGKPHGNMLRGREFQSHWGWQGPPLCAFWPHSSGDPKDQEGAMIAR